MVISNRTKRIVVVFAWLLPSTGCAPAREPHTIMPRAPSTANTANTANTPCADPRTADTAPHGFHNHASSYIDIVLRPKPAPIPRLNVEMVANGPHLGTTLRLAMGSPDAIEQLTVRDEKGPLRANVQSAAPGVLVTLDRAPSPPLRMAYSVRAISDVRAPASALVVAEDRFRGFGENIVLLPSGLEDGKSELAVTIDGAALNAPDAISSLGVGKTRMREASGRALVHTVFAAGALGTAVFTGGLERDEAAWLGYTAFDPRPAAAEIAQIRSALREEWKDTSGYDHTTFLLSTARPLGAYSLSPRASSLVIHVGPSEPWSAALRVGVTQRLIQRWIGGELRVAPAHAERPEESLWFSEGVARFLAARLLRQLELLSPSDAGAFVSGLLATQATSPYRAKDNGTVAEAAAHDPVARAHLMAKGALYALRVQALVRAKSKGEQSLESVTLALLQHARTTGTREPLSNAAWIDAFARHLGASEASAFAEMVLGGADIALPNDALGPCFRKTTGEYTAFSMGFDVAATFDAQPRTVVGLDPKGPAAAKLLAGDVVEDAEYRDGHVEVAAKLSIVRGNRKEEITYMPRGVRRKGISFTRISGLPDGACGTVL